MCFVCRHVLNTLLHYQNNPIEAITDMILKFQTPFEENLTAEAFECLTLKCHLCFSKGSAF